MEQRESPARLKRVVVLGGGFGGLTFCQHFSHTDAMVTLVDRTNHHLFQPLLYQVAMAGLSAPDIAQPIRSILSRKPRQEVLMDSVREFDLEKKIVRCDHNVLHFDYLVLALGSVTSYFGNSEWEQFAPGLKTLDDGLEIRRNVLLAFELAENAENIERKRQLMTIAVVGGGPTGVEVAGACAELAYHVLKRDFDRIDPKNTHVVLVEGGPRVLSHLPEDLSEKARKQLEALGVEVMTGCRVETISEGLVSLEGGRKILAANIIWAAGVSANPLTRKLGVDLDRAGRVKVNPDLSLPGHPDVFAIGDMAMVPDGEGKLVPGVAPAAMQMARHVASVLTQRIQHSSARPAPFKYKDKGSLATIGRSKGVAQFGKVKLSGSIAWLSWLLIHLIFLVGFRNKISVLVSWAYSYFTYKLGARVITGTTPRVVLPESSQRTERPVHMQTPDD